MGIFAKQAIPIEQEEVPAQKPWLRKQKPWLKGTRKEKTFGGFVRNLGENVADVALGFASIPAASVYATFHPQEIPAMASAAWEGLKEDFGEWRDPVTKLYEKPFSAALDVLAVADLPALAVKGASKAAGLAGARGTEAALARTAEKISVPALISSTKEAIPNLLEKMPDTGGRIPFLDEVAATVRTIPEKRHIRGRTMEEVSLGTAEHMYARSEPAQALIDPIEKGLTAREKHAMAWPLYYGDTVDEAIRKFNIPPKMQPRFRQAVDDARPYINQKEQDLISLTLLNPAKAEKVKWMGIATREAIDNLGMLAKPDDVAMAVEKTLGDAQEFTDLKARWAGKEPVYISHYVDYLKPTTAAQRAKYLIEAQNASQALPNAKQFYTAPVLKKTSGFVTQEIYKGNFQIDTIKAMRAHADMVAKQISTEEMLKNIMKVQYRGTYDPNAVEVPWNGKNTWVRIGTPDEIMGMGKYDGERFKLVTKKILADLERETGIKHVTAAPYGFLKIGRAVTDSIGDIMRFYDNGITYKELENVLHQNLGKAFNVDEGLAAFEEVMKGIKEKMPDKYSMFVRAQPIYAIPQPVAQMIRDYVTPSPTWIKLVFGTPTQAWKMLTLGLSTKWIKGNALGNIIFNTLAKDTVGARAYAMNSDAALRALVPQEVSRTTMTRAEGYRPELGSMGDLPGFAQDFEPIIRRLHDYAWNEFPPSIAIQKAANVGYAVNEKVESFFRNANYFQQALNEAARSGRNVTDVLTDWSKGGVGQKEAIKAVNDALYDYNKITPFEKRYIRHMIPFYSFWKHATMFFLNLPLKSPGKAQALKMLSVVGNELKEDQWERQGFKIEDLPRYLQKAFPTGKDAEGNIEYDAASWNPFQMTRVPDPSMISPVAKVLGERWTGREAFTGLPFQSKDWKSFGAKSQNVRTGEIWEGFGGTGYPASPPEAQPDPLSHVLRQWPGYGLLEEMVHPYKQYPAGNILKPMPKMYNGKTQDINRLQKAAAFFGIGPTGEVDPSQLRRSRAAALRNWERILRQSAGEREE